jgi:tetratricopeptide (TPR) repeat protein
MSGDQERFALTAGSKVNDGEVGALEASLAANPGDVELRLKLLGKYFRDHTGERAVQHAAWFIENHPGGAFAGSPLCGVHHGDDREAGYPRLREAWTAAIENHPDNPDVLYNAARFFTLPDPVRCRELLEMGERVTPAWTAWARELGTHSFREVGSARDDEARGRPAKLTTEQRRSAARDALRDFERALSLAADDKERFPLLARTADAAYEAGEPTLAVGYADAAIALAPERGDERHRPDYVQRAHVIRGLVLLDADDLAGAADELHAAGAQGGPHAPVMRSFGPDLQLARRLLARGESAPVLAYLAQCAAFWNPTRVAKWIAEINRGGIPLMFTGFDPSEHGFAP